MQIANRLNSSAAGDGLNNLAGRAAAQGVPGSREDGGAAALSTGG